MFAFLIINFINSEAVDIIQFLLYPRPLSWWN